MHPSDFGSNRARVPPIDRNSSIDGTKLKKIMRMKIFKFCLSIVMHMYSVNRLSTWYEDLEEYEGNLEEMATANLDQVK